MTDLLALSPLEIVAKFGPTGLAIALSFYGLRWLGDRLFKRLGEQEISVGKREARNAEASDALFQNAMAFATGVHQFGEEIKASLKSELEECHKHRDECTDRLSKAEGRLAVLEAKDLAVGMARQEAQKAAAADRLAEIRKGEIS